MTSLDNLLRDIAEESLARRVKAIDGLANMGASARKSLPVLTALLKDSAKTVRHHAISAIVRIDRKNMRAVAALVDVVRNRREDRQLRRHAANALARSEKSATDGILHILKNEDAFTRTCGAYAVSIMKDRPNDALIALVDMLRDDSEAVRESGKYAIVTFGKKAQGELAKALKSNKPLWRVNAAEAVLRIDPFNIFAIRALRDSLLDRDVIVRRTAASALVNSRGKEHATTLVLVPALKDSDKEVRRSAAHALGFVGSNTRVSVEGLVRALRDRDLEVRISAVCSLSRLGTVAKEAVAGIVNIVSSRHCDSLLMFHAIDALGKMGQAARSAIDPLKRALDRADARGKEWIRDALGRIAVSAPERKGDAARF